MRSQVSSVPFAPRANGPSRSFGILSSFPPTPCGIATFSAALAAGLITTGGTVDVVRCGDVPDLEDALVLASLDGGAPNDFENAVAALNRTDVAVVQHEYGLYGGADGADVLAVMDGLDVPSIVVAHTVVRDPSANQRTVLERVCDAADAVVVMTTTAQNRLLEDFDVDPRKVRVIPHGATTPGADWASDDDSTERRRADDQCAAPAHLGSARSGEGHRVGDRGGGQPGRPVSAAELRRGRGDPSQGRGAIGRGVSRDADSSCVEHRRRPVRDVRRRLPQPGGVDATDPLRRPRGAALRLTGSGDVRGAGRRGRGRSSRRVDGVPACGRAVEQWRRNRWCPSAIQKHSQPRYARC